jgi:hypothetical protein
MNMPKDYVKIDRMNTRLKGLVLIAAASFSLSSCGSSNTTDTAATPAGTSGRRSYSGPLPPLPPPEYQLPRPIEVVEAVYDFAGRRPDVLQYVPCFCGCQASGHVGNDDCFVSSRDASGKPTWDQHGMG